jgi:hypothetical protein
MLQNVPSSLIAPLDQGPFTLLSAPRRAYKLRAIAIYSFRRVLIFGNKSWRAIWHSLNSCVLYSGSPYKITVTCRSSVQYKCFGFYFCLYVLGDVYLNENLNSTEVVLRLNPCRDICFVGWSCSLRIVIHCLPRWLASLPLLIFCNLLKFNQ